MGKPQWITAGIAIIVVIIFFAATQNQIFGSHEVKSPPPEMVPPVSLFNADSILFHARQKLSPDQMTRINFLEHSISRGDVKDQQLHIYHQLASFWSDTIKIFEPYAWYTAEAARLENSEKSLTFAAHLFLNSLEEEETVKVKQWEALQAKDLFERALKLNPDNDSSKIGLGEVLVFGGVAMPMQGISMIKEVATRDSNNVYAQMTLGKASIVSGQLDKAVDFFKKATVLQPENLEAVIRLAEAYEQLGDKENAVEWYQKSLPLTNVPAVKEEIEARIAKLKK